MFQMVVHKVVWTAVVAAGLVTNARTLSTAVSRRRAVRESGHNGQLAILARQGVRGEAVTLAVQLVLAGLAAAAWALDEPARAEARAYYLACGWAFAACSLLLGGGSLLDVRDRQRLLRLMEQAENQTDARKTPEEKTPEGHHE
jgi:hypothetical protein